MESLGCCVICFSNKKALGLGHIVIVLQLEKKQKLRILIKKKSEKKHHQYVLDTCSKNSIFGNLLFSIPKVEFFYLKKENSCPMVVVQNVLNV